MALYQARTKAGAHRRITRWAKIKDWFRVIAFERPF